MYETIQDVEYRPTYEYVPRMREVIREIPTVEQEIRTKTHYVVNTAELQRKLVTPVRKQLDDDVKGLLEAASKWIRELKDQFIETFNDIDKIIGEKYSELEKLSRQDQELKERLEKTREEYRRLIAFLEENKRKIELILDV